MLFWHVGATTAFTRYAFRDPAMDVRFLALGAILPDLIDLPVGIALWDRFESVRLMSHSIALGAVLLVVVLVVTRRGRRRKQWIMVAVGVMLHLVLDAMWNLPETLWWPFLGSEFTATGFSTFGAYLRDLVMDPLMWAGEVAGAVYLVRLARKSNLGEAGSRRAFFETGALSAPIGRT